MKRPALVMLALSYFLLTPGEQASALSKKQVALNKCNHNGYVCKAGCSGDADELRNCLKKCERRLNACTKKIGRASDVDVPADGSIDNSGVLDPQ